VDRKVLEARLAQRFQSFSLPEAFTSVFSKPADEKVWSKLKLLGEIIVDAADGVVVACVQEEEELQNLRDAASEGLSPVLARAVMLGGTLLQAGGRVLTNLAHGTVPLTVRLQPVNWKFVPLSAFGQALRAGAQGAKPLEVRALAEAWREPGERQVRRLSAQATFTKLLVDLGQVLFLHQCHTWSIAGKAWVDEAKIQGAARYYLKGQHVGEKPIFDSICAYCGELLYGVLGDAISNKTSGRPVDIDREECAADGQPPFLLRWPPELFAVEVPDVFEYDEASNKLSVRTHHHERPPWKRAAHHLHSDEKAAWLYCDICQRRLAGGAGEGGAGFVPFRDSESLKRTRGLQPPPPPDGGPHKLAAPSGATAELKRKWAQAKAKASKANKQRGTKLNLANLVPEPDPDYWQTAPDAPFAELQTEDARGHLACCNLISSMKKHQDEKGRTAYASSAAETVFFRRNPEQLATTLAFMLGRDEGQMAKIKQSEIEPLRKCLVWLRERNPHVKHYFTTFEKFQDSIAGYRSEVHKCQTNVSHNTWKRVAVKLI